jgi:hypothetical protein
VELRSNFQILEPKVLLDENRYDPKEWSFVETPKFWNRRFCWTRTDTIQKSGVSQKLPNFGIEDSKRREGETQPRGVPELPETGVRARLRRRKRVTEEASF